MKRSAFSNALPVIANAICDSLGVQVVLNAGSPRTNRNTIYLPAVSNDEPTTRKLFLGYVIHEPAHILFSDFTLEFSTPLEAMIDNILEDIRIEKAVAMKYPGAKLYLAEMVEALVEVKLFAPLVGDETPTKLMQQYMLYQLRLNMLGQEAIRTLAEEAEQKVADRLPIGMRVRLDALMYQVEDCTNEKDVQDLSRAIIKMMEEESKKEEDEKEKQQQNSSNPSQQPPPQLSTGKESIEADSQANIGMQNDASAIINQILSSSKEDAIKDLGEALEEVIGQAEVHDPSSTAPFKNYVFRQVSTNDENIDIETKKNCVNGASNALRVRAQSLLQAQTMSSKRSSFTGTRLNVKNLHQAKFGGAVFQKETKGVAVDTAIAILVDRSVSMKHRIELAMDAALATTLAFDRHNVKTAVFSFPYSSSEETGNAVLKRWEDQPAASIPAYLTIGVDGSTPMGEAMMGVCIGNCQTSCRL